MLQLELDGSLVHLQRDPLEPAADKHHLQAWVMDSGQQLHGQADIWVLSATTDSTFFPK